MDSLGRIVSEVLSVERRLLCRHAAEHPEATRPLDDVSDDEDDREDLEESGLPNQPAKRGRLVTIPPHQPALSRLALLLRWSYQPGSHSGAASRRFVFVEYRHDLASVGLWGICYRQYRPAADLIVTREPVIAWTVVFASFCPIATTCT